MLQQPGLVRVKFAERGDDLVEFGLHLASDKSSSLRGAFRRSNP
jgi:hypothetical protein